MAEPRLISCGVRDAEDEIHLECRFADGTKYAAVTVSADRPELASRIARLLNAGVVNEATEAAVAAECGRSCAYCFGSGRMPTQYGRPKNCDYCGGSGKERL